MKYAEKVLILGTVMHSQRLGERHLKPWIVANEDGTILCAHCDCIAGIGETCTHVCAVLFSIDDCFRKESESILDSSWKNWRPKKVQDIDFVSPNKQKETPLFDRNKVKRTSVPELNKDDITSLLAQLKETPRGSVLHSIVRPFSTEISESRLKKHRSGLDLTVPLEECKKIEKLTGEQAQSKAWFHLFVELKVEQPSLSLLKTICYPLRSTFSTKATIYGCVHEKEALQAYTERMCVTHEDFGTESVGLCLNPEYPAFGASPDGLVSCTCCGLGCIEIKCPLCAKDVGVDELSVLKKLELMILREQGI
ncbi:hypothetical protein NQ317_006331 [Molorchus minor]|uniref:YqaJ viral recombinase domain-containing protein n=1 Tax=Molorchus minor TaxID=1323400 RepID=A0ABQ9J4U1_9CUCU|nr:hypothetical protein NQ317_006331 [Molorchus minor]